MSATSRMFPVADASHVGEIRRASQALAAEAGFSKTESGNLAIIATELAGNIHKHAGKGEIVFRALDGRGVEILALDQGKGMRDTAQCLEDGYSTAGSPGTGLGAVRRLSQMFDIYSKPQKGTAIVSQLYAGGAIPGTLNDYAVGAVCLPMPGETLCGDGWSAISTSGLMDILMVDGLGHGPFAAEAAQRAMKEFFEKKGVSSVEMIHILHAALRSTRGAAVAVLKLRRAEQDVEFSGVGNIAGFVLGGTKERGLASYNGTLGHQLRKVQEVRLPWPDNGVVILHSDGLGTKWKLEDYPGLRQRHASVIAGILYRDFQRKRDDVTVLVVKEVE